MYGENEEDVPRYEKVLTKSNYLLGLQCTKLLWVKVHDKRRIPESDESAKYRFKTGDDVEALAKSLFRGGVEIPKEDFKENLKLSSELLRKRVPLFEAAFKFGQLYSRADVLLPAPNDSWDIVEIKSATKVKPVNIHDVSFQKYVYSKVGLNIRKCYLMHINSSYVKFGELEPEKLFMKVDISSDVEESSRGIEERIGSMLKIINGLGEPEYIIGSHCTYPYECPIRKECWVDLPNGNVLDYYMDNKIQSFDLGGQGIIKIDKIPNYYNNSTNHFVKQLKAKKEGIKYERRAIKDFLKSLEYPIHYLDIQSINPAIPKYNRTSPYKHLPFQFSLHIQKDNSSPIEHISFLAKEGIDPRYLFLKILKESIHENGTVLVFDKYKEISILKDTSMNFPQMEKWAKERFTKRIKGLWELFEKFHFFDIDGDLDVNVRYMLPRFSNISHEDLEIRTGEKRGIEYEANFYNETGNEGERVELKKTLRKENRNDTLSMIHIIDALKRLLRGG